MCLCASLGYAICVLVQPTQQLKAATIEVLRQLEGFILTLA